jgi:hypothetical protein
MTITTTTKTSSTIWFKRIAAGAILATGSALVALGGASTCYADASPNMSHPTPHPAFPHQHNQPVPGSSIHHHHQWNHHRG